MITTWPIPLTEKTSEIYALDVDGVAVPVWTGRVREEINRPEGAGFTHMLNGRTDWCSFARFDFDEPVDVSITVNREFETAAIAPRSADISPEIDGQTIRFTITRPQALTLLLDDMDTDVLHLFTHAPETNVPDPDDPNVIYFGPGEHWVDHFDLESGQTVYVDGAAIVRACLPAGSEGRRGGVLNLYSYPPPVFHINQVEDVRITGRGIIDGTLLPHPARNLICVRDARRVQIDGVMLRNSPNWHLPIARCSEILVDGINCLSGRLNSDGINCVSSDHVDIRNCFVRGHDDSFAVKAMDPERQSHDIVYENCTAWNDWGYAFGITYETRADIHHVAYRHCDCIFARHWAIGVHVSDSGTIHDIAFEDMTIDYPQNTSAKFMGRNLIKIDNKPDVWGKDDTVGHVRDILFRHIDVRGENIPNIPNIHIAGADADHPIENVEFEDVTINGQPLAANHELLKPGDHVSGLSVK